MMVRQDPQALMEILAAPVFQVPLESLAPLVLPVPLLRRDNPVTLASVDSPDPLVPLENAEMLVPMESPDTQVFLVPPEDVRTLRMAITDAIVHSAAFGAAALETIRPDRFSRVTWLSRSMSFWMDLNFGITVIKIVSISPRSRMTASAIIQDMDTLFCKA